MGIKSMIEVCREHGLPDPAFTELGTNFRVEFLAKKCRCKIISDTKENFILNREKI